MNTKLLTTTLLTALVLTACGSKQETYTSDYLYANDDIRAKVLAECAENKQSQENCTAAHDAESKKKNDEFTKRMTTIK